MLVDTSSPRLTVYTEQKTWELPLHEEMTSIGRQSTNDIELQTAKASRSHARIERKGDQFVIRDLGSTNGTWLDGRLLEASVSLAADMVVRLGDTDRRVAGGLTPDWAPGSLAPEFIVPLVLSPEAWASAGGNYLQVLTRLAPGVSGEQARAEVVDDQDAVLPAERDQFGQTGRGREADDPEVARMHREQHPGVVLDAGLVVLQARAVGRADLDHPATGLGHDVRHPEAAADLDEFAARDHDRAGRRRRGRAQIRSGSAGPTGD